MFKVGDNVIYIPKDVKAKVIKIMPDLTYLIEFEDKDLIPPQMQVPESYLSPGKPTYYSLWEGFWEKPDNNGPSINKETHCPKCNTPWKETIIGRNTFYDCLKCNLKKEDA